jgi:hypothetical protein
MSIQHGLPLWVVGLFLFICLYTALELGYRIGYSRRKLWKDADTGGGRIVLNSTFALLSLMLAFTYGAGLNRLDSSKKAVLQEANAIRTAYLRADMIAEPERTELKQALRDYANTRLVKEDELSSAEKLETILRETTQAQSKLWIIAQRVVEKSQHDSNVTSLLINSVNHVINIHTNRVAAFVDKLPTAVLLMLLFVASASISIAGFNAGISGKMSRWRMTTFIFILMGVMLIIHDFDHPSGGFIHINQDVISNVLEEIESELYTR